MRLVGGHIEVWVFWGVGRSAEVEVWRYIGIGKWVSDRKEEVCW